jgi:hypothetical protein
MPEIFGLAFIDLDPRIYGDPGYRFSLQLS